jgi:hypothetical protein
MLTDKNGLILKIGESSNLWERYKGGTGNTLDAALHGSDKYVFVAAAPSDANERKTIEQS